MLFEIIKKEIRDLLATQKMIFSAIIIILVMAVNGFVFNINFNKKLAKFNEIENNTSAEMRNQGKSLFNLLFYQQKLIKPPSNLAFISEAEEKMLPNGMWINYFENGQPVFFKEQNIFFSRFNSIDWSFILIYLISFISIAFSYNAFSGEKVKGTLKLVLSNTISKGTLIIGKLIGIFLCIFIPFLIGAILNSIIVELNPNIMLHSVDYALIILFLIAAIIFIMFNILLGFIISTLTSKPIHSLNLVLIFWIFLNIIIPNVSWVFARKIIDVPSEAKIRESANAGVQKIWKSGKYYTGFRWSWKSQPPNEQVKSRAEGSQVRTNLRMQIWQDYLHKQMRQTNIAIGLAKISPFSVFRFISERISDNGFHGYLRFDEHTENYKRTFRDFAFEKDQQDKDSYHLIWNERWASDTFSSRKPVAFEEVPQFEYNKPGFIEILDNCKWDFLILVLWNLVLFVGTFVAFIRYDVR